MAEDDDVTRVFLLDNLAFGRLRRGGRGGTGAALRAVEVRRPALVVMDLGLDDRSGLGLLDRARSFAGVPTTTCAGSQGRRRPSALTGDTSVQPADARIDHRLEVTEVGRVDGELGGDDDLVFVDRSLRVVALDRRLSRVRTIGES